MSNEEKRRLAILSRRQKEVASHYKKLRQAQMLFGNFTFCLSKDDIGSISESYNSLSLGLQGRVSDIFLDLNVIESDLLELEKELGLPHAKEDYLTINFTSEQMEADLCGSN